MGKLRQRPLLAQSWGLGHLPSDLVSVSSLEVGVIRDELGCLSPSLGSWSAITCHSPEATPQMKVSSGMGPEENWTLGLLSTGTVTTVSSHIHAQIWRFPETLKISFENRAMLFIYLSVKISLKHCTR